MAKRHIFPELMAGVSEMSAHRKGKITLRTYKGKRSKLPKGKGKTAKQIRGKD